MLQGTKTVSIESVNQLHDALSMLDQLQKHGHMVGK